MSKATMVKKIYTKEQRYIMRMEKDGFLRKSFWVHAEDYEKVRAYAHKMRAKRTKASLSTHAPG